MLGHSCETVHGLGLHRDNALLHSESPQAAEIGSDTPGLIAADDSARGLVREPGAIWPAAGRDGDQRAFASDGAAASARSTPDPGPESPVGGTAAAHRARDS